MVQFSPSLAIQTYEPGAPHIHVSSTKSLIGFGKSVRQFTYPLRFVFSDDYPTKFPPATDSSDLMTSLPLLTSNFHHLYLSSQYVSGPSMEEKGEGDKCPKSSFTTVNNKEKEHDKYPNER